jgi:triphosphatase
MPTKASSTRKLSTGRRKESPALQSVSTFKRKRVKLSADLSASKALEVVLLSAVDHVCASRETLLTSDDPEGPHQIRVGLRRLRSALHAFKPFLAVEPRQEFVKQCRALGHTVGELRDADVLVTDIVLPVRGQLENHPAFQPLLMGLLEQRELKRLSVRHALEGAAWLSLQGWLERFLAVVDADKIDDAPFSKVSAKALRRSWRKVDACGSRLSALTDTERHGLRKSLKTLRYQVELFGPIYKKRQVGRFLASLRKLQNDFGYLNDVAMARGLVDLAGTNPAGNSQLHHVVGFVIGWHAARAELRLASLEADWSALRKVQRFW